MLMAGLAPAAAVAEGPPMSALNPNAHAPLGFIAPTFDGDWRFRIAINGWATNVIHIETKTDSKSGYLDEDLGWVLKRLEYIVPLDFEVRKGSFGVFFHSLFVGLSGEIDVIGPLEFNWDGPLFLLDIGLSYELGRWRLGEGSRGPEITLEPFAEARVIYGPDDIAIRDLAKEVDLSSTAPVVGLRAFIDLTEHWNLQFQGDYGGFGVDDNHQTWQAVGLIGYRWPGWGAHWNLQVGYRAMRLFDLRKAADILMDGRGANIVFGVEF
jgi:hypothetical protein